MVALLWFLIDVADDTRYAAGRVLRRQRPLGLNRLRHLVAGAALSMRHPINRQMGVYRQGPERGRGMPEEARGRKTMKASVITCARYRHEDRQAGAEHPREHHPDFEP